MNSIDKIARLIERRLPLRILQLVEDDEPERSPLQKLWDTATKHETWKTCMAKAVGEVSPPGWEGTVKAMKGHPDITNPWALAWWMDNQGMSSHKQSEKEGGPGSGRRGGGGGRAWVPKPGGGVMRSKVGPGKPGKYVPAAVKARQQRMRQQPAQWAPKPGGGVTR